MAKKWKKKIQKVTQLIFLNSDFLKKYIKCKTVLYKMVTFWLKTVEIAKSYHNNLFANVYVGHYTKATSLYLFPLSFLPVYFFVPHVRC